MITFSSEFIEKCQMLIKIGALLCIFPIDLYKRVSEVNDNLEKNRLFVSDLEDLIKLSKLLLDREELSFLLKLDILSNTIYLNLKIKEFAEIKKSCGMHCLI